MNKFWVWFFGTFLGSLVAGIVVYFFSPVDAEEFRANLDERYREAMESGRLASDAKRAQLYEELEEMNNS